MLQPGDPSLLLAEWIAEAWRSTKREYQVAYEGQNLIGREDISQARFLGCMEGTGSSGRLRRQRQYGAVTGAEVPLPVRPGPRS